MPSKSKKAIDEPGLARSPRRDPFPVRIAPQLATLAKAPPTTGDWRFEVKFDGWRMLARLEAGKVQLFTRNGIEWTHKLQGLAADLARLPVEDAWLDGEAVVLDANGIPDFNALQNAISSSREASIVFFVFDILYLNGHDIRGLEQAHRTSALESVIGSSGSPRIRLSEAFDADGASALRSACAMGLEGLIAKQQDGVYTSTRSRSWLKLKCLKRAWFVVVGFTTRDKASQEVGSMSLGLIDGGSLVPAGSVGTGWDAATARSLLELLSLLETGVSPFTRAPGKDRWTRRGAGGTTRWVSPQLMVEVAFQEMTPDGHVRHASFKAARLENTVPGDLAMP